VSPRKGYFDTRNFLLSLLLLRFLFFFFLFVELFFSDLVAVAESREDTGDDIAQERSYHERLREATDMPDLQPQQPAASIPLRIEVGRGARNVKDVNEKI
jgi:hypothetical protein